MLEVGWSGENGAREIPWTDVANASCMPEYLIQTSSRFNDFLFFILIVEKLRILSLYIFPIFCCTCLPLCCSRGSRAESLFNMDSDNKNWVSRRLC